MALWRLLGQLKVLMEKQVPDDSTPGITSQELIRIVLTVAYAAVNQGIRKVLRSYLNLTFRSVQVPWDIDHYSEHVKRFNAKSQEQLEEKLEEISKFYELPENLGLVEEPHVGVDLHGRIVFWSLPEILSKSRVVRVYCSRNIL
jgi:hypothetical protein